MYTKKLHCQITINNFNKLVHISNNIVKFCSLFANLPNIMSIYDHLFHFVAILKYLHNNEIIQSMLTVVCKLMYKTFIVTVKFSNVLSQCLTNINFHLFHNCFPSLYFFQFAKFTSGSKKIKVKASVTEPWARSWSGCTGSQPAADYKPSTQR